MWWVIHYKEYIVKVKGFIKLLNYKQKTIFFPLNNYYTQKYNQYAALALKQTLIDNNHVIQLLYRLNMQSLHPHPR